MISLKGGPWCANQGQVEQAAGADMAQARAHVDEGGLVAVTSQGMWLVQQPFGSTHDLSVQLEETLVKA